MEITIIAKLTRTDPPFFKGGPFSIMPEGEYRELMYNKLRELEPGQDLRFIISDDVDWHTDKQRKFFHKLCEIYGRDPNIQTNREEVKREMKARWGVKEDFEYNGERFLLLKSTTRYTKREYMELIEGVISDCLKIGCDIDSQIVEFNDSRVTSYYNDEKDQLGLFEEDKGLF